MVKYSVIYGKMSEVKIGKYSIEFFSVNWELGKDQ